MSQRDIIIKAKNAAAARAAEVWVETFFRVLKNAGEDVSAPSLSRELDDTRQIHTMLVAGLEPPLAVVTAYYFSNDEHRVAAALATRRATKS